MSRLDGLPPIRDALEMMRTVGEICGARRAERSTYDRLIPVVLTTLTRAVHVRVAHPPWATTETRRVIDTRGEER